MGTSGARRVNGLIKKLHSKGRSEQEIAEELGISLQRTHEGLAPDSDDKYMTDEELDKKEKAKKAAEKRAKSMKYQSAESPKSQQSTTSQPLDVGYGAQPMGQAEKETPCKPESFASQQLQRQPVGKRYFEVYLESCFEVLESVANGVSTSELANELEEPELRIRKKLEDGKFYKFPPRNPERLELAKRAAKEHWTKSEAKEKGPEFAQPVWDRKILRSIHPELFV